MTITNSYKNMLKEVERAVAVIERIEELRTEVTDDIINNWDNMTQQEKDTARIKERLLMELLRIA